MMNYTTFKKGDLKQFFEWTIEEIETFMVDRKDWVLNNLLETLKHEIMHLTQIQYWLWIYIEKKDKWIKSIGSADREKLVKYGNEKDVIKKNYDKFVVLPENFGIKSGLSDEVFQLLLITSGVEVVK